MMHPRRTCDGVCGGAIGNPRRRYAENPPDRARGGVDAATGTGFALRAAGLIFHVFGKQIAQKVLQLTSVLLDDRGDIAGAAQ